MPEILRFDDLAKRHRGLTPAIAAAYYEAACVCLNRHHTVPVDFQLESASKRLLAVAIWKEPDTRTQGAWNNEIDATEFGAYALALAAIELVEEMFAVRRAETRTGVDYYVAPLEAAEASDLESWFRLEVSGVDRGDDNSVRQRVQEKVRQAIAGASNLPALAAVVGFRAKRIVMARAEES